MWDMLLSPIIGAVGGIATQIVSYKTHKLDLDNEEKKRAHDLKMQELKHTQAKEIMESEMAGKLRQTRVEGDIAETKKELEAFDHSLKTVPAWSGVQPEDGTALRWYKTIIESLQQLVRVVLTIAFGGMTLWATYDVLRQLSSYSIKLSPDQVSEIYLFLIRGFLETGGLAVGFWFGSRAAKVAGTWLNKRGATAAS